MKRAWAKPPDICGVSAGWLSAAKKIGGIQHIQE
jgi:hypothetical protein